MGLFNFKKKAVVSGTPNDSITSIKALGLGCPSCHKNFENVKEAAKELGIPVEVESINDPETVMSYGAMSMPVLVINEKVVSSGKVLTVKEAAELMCK